ncbi:MAG: DUF1858 domain-containing protein [Lachnospiraceae bacterium]|nr:DUF1858 domain-containing protein [Lachnospiraceae bacterium]
MSEEQIKTNTERENVPQVSKDTMIGELLMIDRRIAQILFGIGMHCVDCPASQMETIAEAAMVHGVNADELVDEINDFLLFEA